MGAPADAHRGHAPGGVEVIAEAAFRGGQPLLTFAEVRHAGGAIARNALGAANQRGRSSTFLLEMVGVPVDPVALDEHLRRTKAALAPFVTGAAYLNFTDGEEKVERTADAFHRDDLARITALKSAVDPDDRFRHGLRF